MKDAGTLTRAELADAVQGQIGLSRAECGRLVESILDHICNALCRGENVKLTGFGTFILRDKPERVGRNPKTGTIARISPRRVLTFRASQKMRDRIEQV